MVLEQQGIWFIKHKSETDSLSQEDYILLMICRHQYKKPAKSKGEDLIHCFQYIAIPGRICIKIQEENVFSKLDLEWIQVFRWGSLGQQPLKAEASRGVREHAPSGEFEI